MNDFEQVGHTVVFGKELNGSRVMISPMRNPK
jgi:hypothetical protein